MSTVTAILGTVENLDDLRAVCATRISADGSDSQAMNNRRAQRAAQLLIAYTDETGNDEFETKLGDLFADLRHLCDALGVDFDVINDRGEFHHHDEIHIP